MKVAINGCYGGFGLSTEAFIELLRRKGKTIYPEGTGPYTNYWLTPIDQQPAILRKQFYEVTGPAREEYNKVREAAGPIYQFQYYEDRTDPDLIAVIEQFGDKASSSLGRVYIVEVPDDVEWTIEDYDGVEWVAEKHRRWE